MVLELNALCGTLPLIKKLLMEFQSVELVSPQDMVAMSSGECSRNTRILVYQYYLFFDSAPH
mgnify:CR=1 FL=1